MQKTAINLRAGKLKKLARELARPLNLCVFAGNMLFAYVWGVWGWRESEIFNQGWWFDTAGHAIFGFCWAFILLYWARKYLWWLYVQLPKVILAIVIMALVNWIETQFWEGAEFFWDSFLQPQYFPHLAKAQKGSLDTTIDILVTSYAAVAAMLLWGAYRRFYAWRYPNEALQEAIEETVERAKLSSAEISDMQMEHRKYVREKIRSRWDKIFLEKDRADP